jgi:hypothetical protein
MERADWLGGAFTPTQARFLMITAITHHRFSSQIWGDDEVRKLHAELAEIELMAARLFADPQVGTQWDSSWQVAGAARRRDTR